MRKYYDFANDLSGGDSGEQQPVTGEWQRCPICEGTGQILADGFTSLVYQTCPTCEGQRIIQKPIIQPPTPEPAGELYWKQLAEVSGKLVEYLKVEAERYFTNDYKKYKELKNQKPEPAAEPR